MKPTFHIIGKDLRDLRLLLPLAGWWTVSVLQPLLISVSPRLPSSPPAIEMMSGVFLGGLAWLLAALDLGLLVLIVSQLAQRDSTVGTTAFWLSRPISGARLLAGKSLFLLLAVILPTVVVQFLMLLFNGVTLYDAVRSAPQIVVLQVLVLSALMMLACLTQNLSRMLFLGVVATVGLAIVQYTLRISLLRNGWDGSHEVSALIGLSLVRNDWDRSLEDSAAIGLSLFFLVVFVAVVCQQYLSRRTKRSLILASSVFPGMILFMTLWPWDFWPAEAPVSRAILDPEQVTARVEVDSLRFHRRTNPKGEEWLTLRGDIAVDSSPAGLVAIPAGISAKQFSSTGKVLAHHRRLSRHLFPDLSPRYGSYFDKYLDMEQATLLEGSLGGVKFLNRYVTSGHLPLELFAIRREHYDGHAGAQTVYEAQVKFVVQRNRMQTMRPVPGAGYDRGSDHGRILAVTGLSYRPSDQGFNIQLSESDHRLTLDAGKFVRYQVVHPSRREALMGSSNFFFPSTLAIPHPWSGIFSMLRVNRPSMEFRLLEGSPTLPENWLEGAELVRLETTHLGVFSKTIRIEDFVLERIPMSPESSGITQRQETPIGAGEWGVGW